MAGFFPESLRVFRSSPSAGPIDVLIVGGTWNPNGEGVTRTFSAALEPARYRTSMVPYPADYGGTVPYADSVHVGRDALIAAVKSAPGQVILAGYSQGAAVAGDIAAAVGRGELDLPAVIACALIADPRRPQGHCVGADPGGYGIAGQRDIPGIRTFWAAAPGDPITALPAGNPLRTVADLSAYFGLSSPEAAARWGASLVDVAVRGQLQRWWSPANWRNWGGALAYARGYLVDGRHTEDYIRHGHLTRLAQALDRWVVEQATAR